MAERATVRAFGLDHPVPEGPLPEGEQWQAQVVPLHVALGIPLPEVPLRGAAEFAWTWLTQVRDWRRGSLNPER